MKVEWIQRSADFLLAKDGKKWKENKCLWIYTPYALKHDDV